MTKEKVLYQLEDLIGYVKSVKKEDSEVWQADLDALNICKELVEKYYIVPNQLDVPTIEDIKRDYRSVLALVDNVKDPEKLRDIGRAYHLTIEINSMDDINGNWDGLDENNIEMVRVESYNNLQYVYFMYNEKKTIIFDVWANEVDAEFITDITIDELEKAYEDGIKWIKERTNR